MRIRLWALLLCAASIGCSHFDETHHEPDAGVPDDGGAPPDAGVVAAGALAVSHLRTEYRVDPIGLDTAAPRFEWRLDATVREQVQTAYQVLVARTPERLAADQGDLWDSGRVASDRTTQVAYAGAPLPSRQVAWWKVRAWDKDGQRSAWSPTARFAIGLGDGDWKARWITTTPAPPPLQPAGLSWIWYPEGTPSSSAPIATRLFRRSVTLPASATVRRASLTLTADDAFDVYINGALVGDGGDWRSLVSLEVGPQLAGGANTIAIAARNTSVSPAGLLAQLQITLGDGSSVTISTDGAWKSSNQAPPADWQSAGYDDSSWPAALVEVSFAANPWGALTPGLGGGGPARYLRRGFTVAQPVKRAVLYATALGLYDASLNGARVGAQHFAPGWTDYAQRLQVQAYDVTDQIAMGDNMLGFAVGDGWYQGKVGFLSRGQYGAGQPRLFAQLELDLADGTRQIVATDDSWSGASGPIIADDLLDGEIYDARRERAGWDRPGAAADGWQQAVIVTGGAAPRLVAQPDDGIQVEAERPAVTVNEVQPGIFVYDLGQNMVGWARLAVQGQRGATVTLRFAEVLNPDGTLYVDNLRGAHATDRYTLRGGAPETWEPHFTSHGFRYVELSGDIAQLSAKPTLAAITGIVAHAATPPTGTLKTSIDYINQLQQNIVWSQKDNFTAVPTDCPQRDERLGWMGDAQIFARTATYNMDVAAFYTKWLRDVDDAQYPNGSFSEVSPRPAGFGNNSTPAWGDAGVIVPWTVYLAYGDERILHEHYAAMKHWVDYLAANNSSFLWQSSRGSDYGDWLSINADTDKEMLATAFWAHSADIVSRAAHVIGNEDDAAKYRALFASIKSAFATAYISADGHIKSDTQTAYALALRFGLLPDGLVAAAGQLLRARIAAKNGYLDTGFLGVGHLLPALSSVGATDVAYQLLANRGFPSWRYEIDHGATTVWERWDGIETDGSFETPTMNSFNHYSFGSVDEWMYGTIAGLQLDETQPGWKHFVVRPQPGGGLTSARATFDSPHGFIVSDWSVNGGTFTLTVTVPVSATATVYLPYTKGVRRDGGDPGPADPSGGYALGSGTWVFTAQTM